MQRRYSDPCSPSSFSDSSVHLPQGVLLRVTLKLDWCPKQEKGILVDPLRLGIYTHSGIQASPVKTCNFPRKCQHLCSPLLPPRGQASHDSRSCNKTSHLPKSLVWRPQVPSEPMQPHSVELCGPSAGHGSEPCGMKLLNLTWPSALFCAHLLFSSAWNRAQSSLCTKHVGGSPGQSKARSGQVLLCASSRPAP